MSATLLENTLYLAGGTTEKPEGGFTSSTSVIKCSLPDLWSGYRKFLKQRWIDVYSLPVKRSTLVSFGGELLLLAAEVIYITPLPTSTNTIRKQTLGLFLVRLIRSDPLVSQFLLSTA